MEPTKSYRVWFSQRNGSSLLCQSLIDTGIAGKPGEHLTTWDQSLCQKYQVDNYEDLKKALWEAGTSDGVFAVKKSLHMRLYDRQFKELLSLRSIPYSDQINHEEIWSDLFPNCKHIYMTRRNKIRQAVSWWKAINDQVWHLKTGEQFKNGADFFESKYDFDALLHLFKEASLRECAIEDYFRKYQLQAFSIVYEDFVMDYEGTIKKVIDFLEIEYDEIQIKAPHYTPTASQASEQWVQRFREDLQKNFQGAPVW